MYNLDSEIINVNQYIFNHKKEFNKEIGVILKSIRNKKNISTELMATRSIMNPSYIIQLENGVNGITLNKFVIICNALEIEPKDVLESFLFGSKYNEDILYNELQKGKNISENILNFIKIRKDD